MGQLVNFYFTETIKQLRDEGNVIVAVFAELKKGFDTVQN